MRGRVLMDLAISISVISSIAASIAALASWRTAHITNKQYKTQQDEISNKYKPIFKINSTNPQPHGYLFDLINVGYSFFAITAVNWDGEEVEVINDFNGIIEKTTTKNQITEIVSRHETLAISIKVEPNANTEGYLEINGFDLNQNEFKYKSPLMIIEKGKITNGIKVTNQFMQ